MKSWSIFSVDVVAEEEVEGLLELLGEVVGDRPEDRQDVLQRLLTGLFALLEGLGLIEARGDICFWIASVYWLPPNEMSRQKIVFAPGEDVDVGDRGADVDERDDAARLDRVVRLVGVLEGEGVHVHEDGRLARLGDDARVVGDLVLLDRDEEDVHRLAAAGLEHDVVEVDVVDVERERTARPPSGSTRRAPPGTWPAARSS